MITFRRALLLFILGAAPALAQSQSVPRSRGQGWSLLSHQTIGQGATTLGVQLGFPGLTVGVLHGLQDRFDLGGRIALNYAHEGLTGSLHPSLKAEAVARLRLLETERIGIGLHLGLGFLAGFAPASPAAFAMTLPVGLVLGLPIGAAIVANLGVEVPLFVSFGPFGGLSAPILVGAGLEYFLDKSLVLSFNTRMGPALRSNRSAEFALQAQLGVGLKL